MGAPEFTILRTFWSRDLKSQLIFGYSPLFEQHLSPITVADPDLQIGGGEGSQKFFFGRLV